MLDLGCGSGVVAIAAARLGAGSVHACDIDPFAVQVSQENVSANVLETQVTVSLDDLESLVRSVGQAAYDVVVSNILPQVHHANLEKGMAGLLRPGGRLIISGFREDKVDSLAKALGEHGLDILTVRRNGYWSCITSQLGIHALV